jgi:DNA topoisomerase-6 subunit B
VTFLQSEFSRVTARVAGAMLDLAKIKPKTRPSTLKTAQVELLHKAMTEVKVMTPPTNCISPIGDELLLKAIEAEVEADFIATATRPPSVYRGNPFQIEVGLAYGGGLSGDDLVTMYRYANRVPLQYQQSACAITKSVLQVDWKKYGLSQSKGALPSGPLVLIVHIASVWVPFTSESKEAVAHYPEIIKEIRLALQDAGRKLGSHIRRRRRDADEHKKRSYIQKYLPHIGIALQDILGLSDEDKNIAVDRLTDVLEETRGGKLQKPVADAAAVEE